MNEFKPVLLLARKSLLLLGALVVAILALVWGLAQLASSLQTQVAQQQAALQEQQGLAETRQTDLANVRQHIERYQLLRNQGLVGDADRPLWVEQLQESHQRLQLPPGLSVQLQAPKLLSAGDALAPEPVAEPDPTQPEPLRHDLQFEVRNVVESEVFSLVRDFREHAKGRFRVNACKLLDAKDTGLLAQCVLRFISVPVAPPAEEVSPATPAPDAAAPR